MFCMLSIIAVSASLNGPLPATTVHKIDARARREWMRHFEDQNQRHRDWAAEQAEIARQQREYQYYRSRAEQESRDRAWRNQVEADRVSRSLDQLIESTSRRR